MTCTVALLVITAVFGYPPDREPADISISHGSVVSQVDKSLFIHPSWQADQIVTADLYGDSIVIAVFSWPGNAACVTVFKAVEYGYQYLGEFTNMFGGNGIEFSVSQVRLNGTGELEFAVEWTAHLRGYLPDPDQGDSYVAAEDISSSFRLVTDGDTLRIADGTVVIP